MKKLSLLLFAVMLLLFACQKDTTPTADKPTDEKLAAIESRLAKALAFSEKWHRLMSSRRENPLF